ncbi:MAG: hypothetical protein ACLRWP_12220 [Bilophila wadsworthia]
MVKAIPQRTGFPTLNREGYSWVKKIKKRCRLRRNHRQFIETQRISPSNFAEHFPAIYKIVLDTLEANATQDDISER